MRLNPYLAGLCAAFLCARALAAEPLPQRWVSVGSSLSEWIDALGGQDKLVGVDSTSQHPAAIKALASIGYQRQLAAEGILSLEPDILVGTEEMGPPPVLEQLKDAGVRIETLSARADLTTLERNLGRLGELLGDQPRAARVLAGFRQTLERQAAWVAAAQRDQEAPWVLLLLGHAGSRPMAAGRDTAAAWLIEHAGGRNVSEHAGYRALSSEALMALDPQVLIFTDRSLDGEAARAALFRENPALAVTRAAKDGRLLVIDPTLLVGGLGPRLPAALAELSAAFYPTARKVSQQP